MAQEGGQVHETTIGVNTLTIPAQQSPDRERAPQIMEPGRRDACRNGQFQFRDELMERLGNGGCPNATVRGEGEQW